MRTTSSRIEAVVSASALAAVTVVGGAGIAQADSLDLGSIIPGSSAPDPSLELVIGQANPEGVSGTLTAHNVEDTDTLENCVVSVSTAEVASLYEDHYLDEGSMPVAGSDQDDALQAASALHRNWIALATFEEGERTTDWTGLQGSDTAAQDYRAGAWVTCDLDDEEVVAFAYEADPIGDFIGSVVGSVDVFGSLAASDS